MVYTKKIIKETFWEILEEKPYNKITVQDIVNRCQVNRNTFYYHFQDIPSLMSDSIEDWATDVIREYGTYASPVDCITYMAQECMKRKNAFLHLFRSVHKDVFLSRLNQTGEDIIHIYVDNFGEYKQISKEKKEIVIKYYKCIFVGSVLDWLEEDASYDLAKLYREMCEIFAGASERAIAEQMEK